jgi:hypothetical protein
MSDTEFEHWMRYDFLPKQRDGAFWRNRPVTEAARHFLELQEERIEELSRNEPE